MGAITNFNLILFILALNIITNIGSKCSYEEKCEHGKSDMINIHVIPHTHDDAGWLKTVDEYYIGSKKYIDRAAVLHIIDSVIAMLENDISRKFSYVEGAFIYRWLLDHSEDDKKRIKKLVENGQLEILSGGWVMNDEACTHYNDIINQMSLGFKMYQDAFGDCAIPRTGWQIDPFGHSAAYGALLAAMGFDGMFFGRVSDKIKHSRQSGRGLEFLWHTHPNYDSLYGYRTLDQESDLSLDMSSTTRDNDIFVSILPNLYQAPVGFCYDIFCGDDPIQDNPNANGYNVPERIMTFLRAMEVQAKNYDTNHILITMGSDFHFQSASSWYNNLDKLIEHVNIKRSTNESSPRFNMFYSTPGCYLYALNKAKGTPTQPHLGQVSTGAGYDNVTTAGPTLPAPNFPRGWPQVNGGDFFPLVNIGNQMWTGYFTSRPTLKGMVRDASRFLQVCKQVEALATLDHVGELKYLKLEMALALLQHHDGVSGTAKQYVTYDYMERMASGYPECQEIIERGFKKLAIIEDTTGLTFCPLLNISRCNFSQENNEFDVLVYNPLAWSVRYFVNIPVKSFNLIVRDVNGAVIPSQITEVSRAVLRIPERNYLYKADGSFGIDGSLVFASDLPPLSAVRYKIRPLDAPDHTSPPPTIQETPTPVAIASNDIRLKRSDENVLKVEEQYFIENKYLKLEFDPDTKAPVRLINKEAGITVELRQSFGYYGTRNSMVGYSGAYVFRANTNVPTFIPTPSADPLELTMIKGPIMQQARQKVTPWVDQEFTLYNDARAVEVVWTVGPVPLDDRIPKDIVTIFQSDIRSTTPDQMNHFYTDSNARFMVPRSVSVDAKATNASNFVGENYYPINSKIYIKDQIGRDGKPSERQLGLVVDRSQGGSSLENGSLEVMLHRRLLYDDALGVGEPLNERGSDDQGLIARGRHWLVFDAPTECDLIMTQLAQLEYLKPEIMFLPPAPPTTYTPLNREPLLKMDFPPNLHLLTLSRWDQGALIRLEHIYSPGEHPVLSKPVTIDLTTIFSRLNVHGAVEMALGGNQKLSQVHRFTWPLQFPEILSFNPNTPFSYQSNLTGVTLYPLDIKTYYITTSTR